MVAGAPDYGIYKPTRDSLGRPTDPKLMVIAFYGASRYSGPSTIGLDDFWTYSALFADADGDWIEMDFYGPSVSLLSQKDSAHGIFNVEIDGTAYDDVDLYDAASMRNAITFIADNLSTGKHTIKFTNSGTKNASSSGIEGYLEGILVDATYNLTNLASNYYGANKHFVYSVAAAHGVYVRPTTANASFNVAVASALPTGTNTIGSVKITDGTETATVTAEGYLDVKTHTPDYWKAKDFTAAQSGTVLITPLPGKRLQIVGVYISTESKTEDVSLHFAPSGKIAFKMYIGKESTQLGNSVFAAGGVDEPVEITCGAGTFISVSYNQK